MNPRNPAILAGVLSLASAFPAFAQQQPAPADPAEQAAKAELALDDAQIKDLCTLGKETDYQSGSGASWRGGCEATPIKYSDLLWVKKLDRSFGDLAAAASARRQTVTSLYELFTTNPELSFIQDDKNRGDSQKVYKCLTKLDCLSSYKEAKDLADIAPPITGRTFPTWLSPEQASKMLPFALILENEKLRGAKFNELQVPLDQAKRKDFCKEHADACKEFDKTQAQIKTNKAVITGLKDNKGITDPAKFALFVENGRQGTMTEGSGSKGVLSQWSAAYTDDPSKPFKPVAPQHPDSTAPPPAPKSGVSVGVGPVTVENAGKAWAWATGAAGGLFAAGAGVLAWRKSKAKAEEELAAEDAQAQKSGEFQPGDGLTDAERSAVAEWKGSEQTFDQYVSERNTYGKLPPGLDTLYKKYKSGQYVPK